MIEIDISPNIVSGYFLQSVILSWHGFFSFVAVSTALILVGRWASLRGIDSEIIYSIAIWAIIGGIVGARIVHVIDNWQGFYSHHPIQIFYVWSGGIGIWGAILGGFIGGAIYSMIAGYPVGIIADLTAPALLFTQSIGRLGDIVNGEHCSKGTDFILGFQWINPSSAARLCSAGFESAVQPAIMYEMLWAMVVLVIIWRLKNSLKPDGMIFTLYLALYSMGRFVISFAREDRVWALGMQEAHYIALLVLAITVPLLAIKARWREGLPQGVVIRERGTRSERRRRARLN